MSTFPAMFGLSLVVTSSTWAIGVESGPPVGPHRETAVELTNHRDLRVGDRIEDVAFTDLDGSAGRLSDFAGAAALVVVVRETTCPLSKRYGPRIADIEETYADRDIAFLYVNFSRHDSDDDMRKEHAHYGFDGRYVADREHTLGRVLHVGRTTEVFVLDRARTLRYRGAIDDQYGIGYQRSEPRKTFLRDALDEVLASRTVTVRATSSPGCAIAMDHGSLGPADVTWHGEISRIVQENCMACHRANGPAPFSLDMPEVVHGRRAMIRYVLEHDIMPPWHATDSAHPFRNDRRLATRDKQALLSWLDGEGVVGEASDAPVARVWPDEWQIGDPDTVIELPVAFRIPAEGSIDYRYISVKTDFPEDKWVRAVEFRPTAPEVVHHALIFVEQSADRRRQRDGLAGYFAAMVPGQGPTVYEEGFGKRLPAGATLTFQMHYTPNGTEAFDQTRVALVFCDEPPKYEVRTSGVSTTDFSIPAGADDYMVTASARFRHGGVIDGFAPHMHLRGKAFRIDLTYPDGETETVLDVPKYDFNWQTMYRFIEPLKVPGGTTMKCTAWYDNSSNNPANPDPDRVVGFGEQTWDEMMVGYFEWWR